MNGSFLPAMAVLQCFFGSAAALARTTVFITGATDGIGRHTAGLFVRERLRDRSLIEEERKERLRGDLLLLIHGRNETRLRDTKAVLLALAEEENKKEAFLQVETLCADLSCMKEVRRLAEEVETKTDQLTVFIQNAGTCLPKLTLTAEGLETSFAVKVAAPFLLLSLLMPLLTRSYQSRVLMVTSIWQRYCRVRVNLEDLQLLKKKDYDPADTLAHCDLMVAMIAHEAAERVRQLQAEHPLVYSLDPGRMNTKMLRARYTGLENQPMRANAEFDYTHIYAPSFHGKYFMDRIQTAAPDVYDAEKRRRLWYALEEITNTKCL